MCYHYTIGKWNAGTKKDNLVFHKFQLKIIKSSFDFFAHSKKKKKKKIITSIWKYHSYNAFILTGNVS